MIHLLSKLVAVWTGRSGWGSSREAAKQRSYYRR